MKLRRRRYIVNAGFQWRFALGFVAASLTGSLVSTGLFNLFSLRKLEELQWSVHISAETTGEILQSIFVSFNLFGFLFVFLLFVVTGIGMMSRMRGPIYRMINDLKRIRDGDLSSPLILRHKDEFRDVALTLNEMLDKTRERFSKFNERYEEISKALSELEIAHAKGMPVKERGDQIIDSIQKLQNEIQGPED